MPYCWIILVQGFCPLKIQIIQFPDGFHLNIIKQVFLLLRQTELKHKLKDVHGSYVQRRKMNANTSLFFPTMESIKQAQVPKTRVRVCVKWKPAPTQDGLFPLRQEGEASTIPNTRVLYKVKRGRPTQAQEKEQLILFCLYLCLCFILSCLQHKCKDNFASVARENYNPVQNGRKNVDPADTPKIKDEKIMARLKATCLIFGGMKACCSILFCPVGLRSFRRDLTTPMRVRM